MWTDADQQRLREETRGSVPTDLQEQQAGKSLDRLVAEQVMGLMPCDWHVPGCWIPKAQPPLTGHYWSALPDYSTAIAAAMEIVTQRANQTPFGEFELMLSDGYWQVRFDQHGDWTGADTAPLAICLAALKAVEP